MSKGLFARILRVLVNARPMPRADLATAGSVLFLRYDRLGDMVISTGLFRLVRESFPGIRIHVLASPANSGVIRNDPNVERVHVFRKKKPLGLPGLIRELRRERFDAVVNLVFYPSFTGALISRLGAPGRAVRVRVATGDGLDHFYNVNIRRRIWGGAVRTMQEETLSVFEYLGGDLSGRDTAPAVYPGEERLARAAGVISGTPPSAIPIGVNIAAGDACREWSTERWAETLKLLLERFPGSTLYLFAPPGDDRGNRLANLFPDGRVRVPAPSPDILDVAAVMKRMSVLVTPDTAMVHIADALGVPVVAMYISHEKLVLWKPCRSVFRGLVSNDGTMDSIRPAEVVNAVSEALEDRF